MKDYNTLAVDARKKNGGMIFTGLKTKLETIDDLATYYTPGIAQPCREIAEHPERSKQLTIRKNTVAVISDGSAVLGLGNIGPEAALPVMEGKSMLFKQFGGVDAFPIVLATQDTEEIIETVKRIAPTFGGINLEDISAPRCFEIEERLKEALDIPVFHDDQHGTAIVVLAALINALKVVEKKLETVRIVMSGSGAAGVAIAKLLKTAGAKNIELADSKGMVCCTRDNLNSQKQELCSLNCGSLADGIKNADVFIGVSKAGIVTKDMVRSMNENAIIFALANPTPEIMPDIAKSAGAAVVASGRSDFPNQINNVLVFPGLFRGLLDKGVTNVTDAIKLNAATALANLVENPTADKVIPLPFDENVAPAIANSV